MRRFLGLLPVLVLAMATAHGQSALWSNASSLDQTAKLIGVAEAVTQLRAETAAGACGDRWQMLRLHQSIYEQITAASLEVDATVAQIDNEIAQANEVHSYLSDRRDRTVTRDNLLSAILGGGIGATSSGLQLSSTLSKPSAAVGIAAGSLSAGFGVAGIHAQKGESSRFDFSSNMLAELFDRPALPDSHYPAAIMAFLQQAPAHSPGLTRLEQLLQTWVAVKRIDSLASADKIARLTSQPADHLRLSIDDFEDRGAMLGDVRARISFLKRDLGALLASLPPLPAKPPNRDGQQTCPQN